jgi:hypothetical protein
MKLYPNIEGVFWNNILSILFWELLILSFMSAPCSQSQWLFAFSFILSFFPNNTILGDPEVNVEILSTCHLWITYSLPQAVVPPLWSLKTFLNKRHETWKSYLGLRIFRGNYFPLSRQNSIRISRNKNQGGSGVQQGKFIQELVENAFALSLCW